MLLSEVIEFGCPLRELAHCSAVGDKLQHMAAHLRVVHNFQDSSPFLFDAAEDDIDYLRRLSSKDLLFCQLEDQTKVAKFSFCPSVDGKFRIRRVGGDPILNEDGSKIKVRREVNNRDPDDAGKQAEAESDQDAAFSDDHKHKIAEDNATQGVSSSGDLGNIATASSQNSGLDVPTCPLCREIFSTKLNVVRHMKKLHKV